MATKECRMKSAATILTELQVFASTVTAFEINGNGNPQVTYAEEPTAAELSLVNGYFNAQEHMGFQAVL